MTTLSANYTTTLDRAIEKELGKGSVVHTMVGDKSKPNTITIVVHTPKMGVGLEDKVAAGVKKALKAEAYAITFNSPKKFNTDSYTYTGRFVIRWPTVKEELELPLLRALTMQEAAMPAMKVPGIVVTVPQALRDQLGKAVRALGYEIESAEYSGGSTQWTAWIEVKKNFDIKKFEDKLREKLNHDGWLEIGFQDLGDF